MSLLFFKYYLVVFHSCFVVSMIKNVPPMPALIAFLECLTGNTLCHSQLWVSTCKGTVKAKYAS